MINKNQYEKSIIALKENIPIFVRNSYTKFINTFQKTVECLKALSETNPSSADKIAREIKYEDLAITNVLTKLISDKANVKFIRDIEEGVTVFNRHSTITADEEFNIVNGRDVYAPVECIRPVITQFGRDEVINQTHGKVPIMFDIQKSEYSYDGERLERDENHYHNHYTFDVIDVYDIEGMTGERTVLDNLCSYCGIDIVCLFKRFQSKILDKYSTSILGSEGNLELLSNMLNAINEKDANDFVTEVTSEVLTSAVATYLVFAGKLKGSKQDSFDWMYTTFVKDSMNHFDRAHYPVNANITRASGHGDTGKGYGNVSSSYDESPMNIILNEESNGSVNSDRSWKSMIYRNIRLQYSSWAAVINAVLKDSFIRKAENLRFAETGVKSMGVPVSNFASSESEFVSICRLIQSTLILYVGAKYRTYNTEVQISDNMRPIQSSKLAAVVISSIQDELARKYAKDTLKGVKGSLFIPHSPEIIGVVSHTENVKNALADTFMQSAYLLMLNYVHATTSKIMEETDPVTGKTNKVLFEEIYSGVKHKIYMDIEKYTRTNNADVEDSLNAYTPYILADWFFDKNEALKDLYINDEMRNKIDGITVGNIDENILKWYSPYHYTLKVPLVTEYTRLKSACDLKFAAYSDIMESNNRLGSLFPKNKFIVDGLSKFGQHVTNRVFGSLESANECVNFLRDRVSEGADAMGNNSCYSALAGIGGGITELEIRSAPATNELDESVAPLADNDGHVIKAGTTDTEDMQNAVTHALENAAPSFEEGRNQVVEKYNKLFNSFILGIK